MSFLDELEAETDCASPSCPWPHDVCEFSLCETCKGCPTAIELRGRLAKERARYVAESFAGRVR